MAVYDTAENKRTRFTLETIRYLEQTVDLINNRIVIVDNNSCEETKDILSYCKDLNRNVYVVTLQENVGTAKAINRALSMRRPDEFFVKMDNDVIIHKKNWLEEMEEVMRRQPNIGILGLKRPDLEESPYAINTDQRSRLLMVPHERGQRWRIVEECKQVMGTCTMLNPALLEKVGYFYQMDGLYGFDDSLMCVRSTIAGFLNCFLHGVDVDHIDPGGTEYTDWKAKYAGEILLKYASVEEAYKKGLRSIYEKP